MFWKGLSEVVRFIRIFRPVIHGYSPSHKLPETKYDKLTDSKVEALEEFRPLFCPQCHKLVAQTRKTSHGTEIQQHGKSIISSGNTFVIKGKKQEGFPISCPDGHRVIVN